MKEGDSRALEKEGRPGRLRLRSCIIISIFPNVSLLFARTVGKQSNNPRGQFRNPKDETVRSVVLFL